MDSDENDADAVTEFARMIYDTMNVEPRRMNVAIELAKRHWEDIQRTLVEQGLRTPDATKIIEP